jgi:hypothetical protein
MDQGLLLVRSRPPGAYYRADSSIINNRAKFFARNTLELIHFDVQSRV